MDVAHQDRVARNEAFFRDVNRSIEEAAIKFGRVHEDQDVYELMCECAISECQDMIDITLGEYKTIRGDSARFAIKPDHLFPRAEKVVDKNERYWTVEKIEHGERITELLDDGAAIPVDEN